MPTPRSLDDAVLLLLQLEPHDRDALASLRESLAELAFGNQVSFAVQPLVARAVRALGPLAAGSAPDPAAAFAEVSALLERVMDASAPAALAAEPRASEPRASEPQDAEAPAADTLPA